MKIRGLYKLDSIVIIFIFCASIYTPFIVGLIEKDIEVSRIEKRKLSSRPGIPHTIKDVVEYPQQFNTYFTDHFGFRQWFYKRYIRLMLKVDRDSASSDVTFGQDGWMFLGTLKPGYNRYDDPMGDAINVNLYSQKQLEEFARSIMAIKNWLKDRGIEYIYVIAPSKHTIYFEKMPVYIKKYGDISATDQLTEYLLKHTDVRVLDLRQALIEKKNSKQLFYKTDTHWNHNGANVAQYEIMKEIESIFPGKIKSSILKDNEYFSYDKKSTDLASFANIGNVLEEGLKPKFKESCSLRKEPVDAKWNDPVTMTCDGQKLTAVIFRDSFFAYLKPYFERKFKRSTYIWKRLNRRDLEKYVAQEKPDIIIDEVVERIFPDDMPTSEFNQ